MSLYPMMNLRASRHPSISYRPIRPSDLEVLVKIHGDLFPIRYELEFFHSVVHGRDIVSWGAVDRNSPNGEDDELIGFVTARIVMAKESEIEDMLSCDKSRSDQSLVYILTLGVVESYRNLGIGKTSVPFYWHFRSSGLVSFATFVQRFIFPHLVSKGLKSCHFHPAR
ncbi:putative histone acetyltransferase [Helianthus anomalus]